MGSEQFPNARLLYPEAQGVITEVRRNATRPTKFDFKKPDRWGVSNIEFSGGGAAMDYIGSTYANALGNYGVLSCLIVQRKSPSQSSSFWLHLPLHLQEWRAKPGQEMCRSAEFRRGLPMPVE